MKKFKFQEVINFIKETPDDTPIDFGNSTNDENCGCLIVQFGRSKGLDFSSCNYKGDNFYTGSGYGFYGFPVAIIEDFPHKNVVDYFNGDHAATFGEVKEYLKREGKL